MKILLDNSNFKIYKKYDVIFPDPLNIYIITAGHVIVYDHRENFDQPKVIAFYGPGDIVGAPALDNGISTNPEVWF